MKNYFSTVTLPMSNPTPDSLVKSMAQLIEQLRFTLNNIDVDNLTPQAVNTLKRGGIHIVDREAVDSDKLDGVKKGDIVLVKGTTSGRLMSAGGIYICIRD